MIDLQFTGPKISPEGLRFEGYAQDDVFHFVLPRDALAALGGKRPRLSHMLAAFQRWRPHIYEVAERRVRVYGAPPEGRTPADAIVITAELVLETPIRMLPPDANRLDAMRGVTRLM